MANTKANKPVLMQAPRGTQDILPVDQKYWEYVVELGKSVFRDWNWHRIDTPIFEETDLFQRAVGEETDIVSKELFELKSRGKGGRYSLRPEGTAAMARAYIEHGLRSRPKPVKLFMVGPMFRYERPQAGRKRQHTQFDWEVFGSGAPITDVEVMYMADVFLSQLGLDDYVFQVNTLGEPDDRKEYIKLLKAHYRRNRRKLCRNCGERLTKNPLRVLDCKEEKCQQVANTSPRLLDHLSDESKQHFERVLKMLDGLEVAYEVAPWLVRGLDYYTGVVWEVQPKKQGAQSALVGGGRYDGLVKQLGGRVTPAVGGSMGVERIIEQIKEEGIELTTTFGPQVFVAHLGEAAKITGLKMMRRLQEAQIHLAGSIDRDGMQPQLKQAARLKVKWVVIIGQKEVLDKTVILRNTESGMQEVVAQDTLPKELAKRLEIPD